jgi:hypothetical protein
MKGRPDTSCRADPLEVVWPIRNPNSPDPSKRTLHTDSRGLAKVCPEFAWTGPPVPAPDVADAAAARAVRSSRRGYPSADVGQPLRTSKHQGCDSFGGAALKGG